jgi:hypothetical protein
MKGSGRERRGVRLNPGPPIRVFDYIEKVSDPNERDDSTWTHKASKYVFGQLRYFVSYWL